MKALFIKILETDQLFNDCPEPGDTECICSRCSEVILQGEMPYRVATTAARAIKMSGVKEYRYCEACLYGRKYSPDEEDTAVFSEY